MNKRELCPYCASPNCKLRLNDFLGKKKKNTNLQKNRLLPAVSNQITMENILNEIKAERQRQDAKWGEQNHHPFAWLAILGEEVGEVNKAALEHNFSGKSLDEYREELIQVASVSVAMIECLDRNGS